MQHSSFGGVRTVVQIFCAYVLGKKIVYYLLTMPRARRKGDKRIHTHFGGGGQNVSGQTQAFLRLLLVSFFRYVMRGKTDLFSLMPSPSNTANAIEGLGISTYSTCDILNFLLS